METHVSYLRSGRGVLAILAFTGRLCPKWAPFQTLGLWKDRDLTCWNIWKGWEICHCSLWKTQKGWQMEIMVVKKWRKRSGFVLYLYFNDSAFTAVRVIFVWPWKTVSVSVHYLFYQPMDEKIKTWTLSFSAKENAITEKVSFDWPIVLQYDVKAKYPLFSRKFSGMIFFDPSVRLTNQKPRAFVRSVR